MMQLRDVAAELYRRVIARDDFTSLREKAFLSGVRSSLVAAADMIEQHEADMHEMRERLAATESLLQKLLGDVDTATEGTNR